MQLDGDDPFETIGVRPLGHVASSRGVELLAVNGNIPDFDSRDTTTTGWFFHSFIKPPTRGWINIDSGAGQEVPRLSFFPPGLPITWSMGSFTASICHFDTAFISDLLEQEAELGVHDLDCILSTGSDRLVYLGHQIFREAQTPGFGATLLAEAVGIQIALEIARCKRRHWPEAAPLRGGLAPWQMHRLESFVRDHLGKDLSLQCLAAVIGVSARHLSRVVKLHKGISVHRWVADLRLAEARRLLTQTDMPLHEIAEHTAFKSASAFATAFRSACGLRPSDFRRIRTAREPMRRLLLAVEAWPLRRG